uniref:Circularly permutated Ras protein 1-like n=1 Tax=Callorhinchus milii TaxID=7868 RepID=A0A4W3I9R6_CALMI|eukprot:gi/632941012/ref/XP_007885640.1/ PREDICTED: circularly permutated Ras protein 1-like [Callorhinchus milii]
MEFACSHIVYNPLPRPRICWDEQRRARAGVSGDGETPAPNPPRVRPPEIPDHSIAHHYDNGYLRTTSARANSLYAQVPKHRTRNPVPPRQPEVLKARGQYSESDDSEAPPLPPRPSVRKPDLLNTACLSASLPATLNPPTQLPPPRPKRSPRLRAACKSNSSSKANVNVVSISLGKLVDLSDVGAQAARAVQCRRCPGALSSISRIHHRHLDVIWTCEFCQQQNVITRSFESIPWCPDVTYLLGPTNDDYINVDDSLVVFCVDVSGSMSVTNEIAVPNEVSKTVHISRLQSVQEAIQRSLLHMLQTCPQRRVALVTFHDEVTIYGDGLSAPLTLTEDELWDSDYLHSRASDYPTPLCIAESIQTLSQRVHKLEIKGTTALGSAALISIVIASKKPGSKVIICTDGKANTGMGFLTDVECEDDVYKQFYTELGEKASLAGVIVSVLTIEGTECRLAEIGSLADRTGGKVNIVNPSNLATEIQSTLEDDVIATDVTVTFVVTEQMYFGYEEQTGNKLVKNIGNVTKDTEVTFEFGIKESHIDTLQEQAKLPFQLQVHFRTRDNRRGCRIISQEKHIASNICLVEDSVNITVLGIHAAQLSARLTMQGRVKEACREMQAQKELIQRIVEKNQDQEEEEIYQNWLHCVATVCEDLSQSEQNVKAAKQTNEPPGGDSVFKMLSDEVASVVYRLKNAKSKMLKKPPPRLVPII